MKKLKVKYNNFPYYINKFGYLEGGTFLHGREDMVLVYFPDKDELKFCELSLVTPIGYEEV